jgi:hypothetical protein
LFLFRLGDDAASFTKEEMQQGKHTDYEKQLHEEMLAAGLALIAAGDSLSTSSSPPPPSSSSASSSQPHSGGVVDQERERGKEGGGGEPHPFTGSALLCCVCVCRSRICMIVR